MRFKSKNTSLIPQFFLALLTWPLYFVLHYFFPQPLPSSTSPLQTPNPSFLFLSVDEGKKLVLCIVWPYPPHSPLFNESTKSLFFSYSKVQSCEKTKEIWKKRVSFHLPSLPSAPLFANFLQQPLVVYSGSYCSLSTPSQWATTCPKDVNLTSLSNIQKTSTQEPDWKFLQCLFEHLLNVQGPRAGIKSGSTVKFQYMKHYCTRWANYP